MEKRNLKRKFISFVLWPIMALMIGMPFVSAEIDSTITAQERAQFDKILEPVMKIYHLMLYVVSVIAICYGIYIGIQFMISGGDAKKRDEAKTALTYVGFGLLVVWAAPYVVQFMVA